MSDEPLAMCCRLLADSQAIIEAKNAEIELLRGYRDEAESQAAIAALAADRLRLTDDPLAECCRHIEGCQNIIAAMHNEIERLRLTDAEREAVEVAVMEAEAHQHAERAALLRAMLERMGCNRDSQHFTTE